MQKPDGTKKNETNFPLQGNRRTMYINVSVDDAFIQKLKGTKSSRRQVNKSGDVFTSYVLRSKEDFLDVEKSLVSDVESHDENQS